MDKLLCLIGMHAWSAFIHVPSRCADEKFCKSCEKTISQNRHRYGKWEFTTQNINGFVDGELKTVGQYTVQRRSCNDCNYIEFQKAHA